MKICSRTLLFIENIVMPFFFYYAAKIENNSYQNEKDSLGCGFCL
jgi:hypothetical protein